MSENEYPTLEKFVIACLMASLGLYIVAGLAVAANTSDWPSFWPPMALATAPLEIVSTAGSVVFMALLYGGVVAVLGPLFLILGATRIVKYWKHRAHFLD
jgi:hypothetical protein